MKLVTSETFETTGFEERDWENLIILDACRFDVFERNNPFDVKPEPVYSNASHTHEFLKKNFAGEYLDTVYVSASPQVAQFGGKFAHVEHVWKSGWSEEHDTVLPETVTDKALETAERFPDKRLVIHYMQPHFPFIDHDFEEGTFRGSDRGRKLPSIWERLYAGQVEEETVRRAYEDNLKRVLPEVERLVKSLKGKTVVTSDHGNLFGKKVCFLPFKAYGHPNGVKDPELNQVPWLELPFDSRKDISEAEQYSEMDQDEEEIKDRLENLGYRR